MTADLHIEMMQRMPVRPGVSGSTHCLAMSEAKLNFDQTPWHRNFSNDQKRDPGNTGIAQVVK